MRMILGYALMAFLVVGVSADDKKEEKIDLTKLIGKWELEKNKWFDLIIEFGKDGKVSAMIDDVKLEGTYKVGGGKVLVMLKNENNEIKLTIQKWNDTEMTLREENSTFDIPFRKK